MPISAKWKHKSSIHIGFIVFNGGVTTFFAKSVSYHISKNEICILAYIGLRGNSFSAVSQKNGFTLKQQEQPQQT